MSFRPASRLISDSVRSPIVPTKAMATPATTPHHQEAPRSQRPTTPTAVEVSADPAKPSHDFFGDRAGAIGCLPKRTPSAHPPVSLAMTISSKTTNTHGERQAASINTTNEARKGT